MEESFGSNNTDFSACKQKLLKVQETNEGDGTMSKLPEPLINHILSFLPTKDAVRTSVLSKKWIFRWTFITKLNLDDTVFYSPKRKTRGKMNFVNFVYRALLLSRPSRLRSFSLVMTNKYDVSLLNTWISNILIRRVLAQSRVAKLPLFGMLSHLELGLVGCEGITNFDKELLNSAAVPDCLTSTLQVNEAIGADVALNVKDL
ncbi:F-box/LRR-repeat protein, partial [Mucuna pruriens]